MGIPSSPYQPYAALHINPQGPGDARPTAVQVAQDLQAFKSLQGQPVVITGASSGLGLETARVLYECGATLFLTARDMPKLEKAIERIVDGSEVYPVQKATDQPPRPTAIEMHLDDLESVRAAARSLLSHTSSITRLILNAGVMACPLSYTSSGFETQMGTNHMAHFLFLQLVKPALLEPLSNDKKSTSRVIFLSSGAHRMSPIRFDDMHWRESEYNKWKAYGQSKTANIYTANALTRRYASQGLIGLSICPGPVETDLSKHLTEADWKMMGGKDVIVPERRRNVAQGAATVVWASLSPHYEDVRHGVLMGRGVGRGVRSGRLMRWGRRGCGG